MSQLLEFYPKKSQTAKKFRRTTQISIEIEAVNVLWLFKIAFMAVSEHGNRKCGAKILEWYWSMDWTNQYVQFKAWYVECHSYYRDNL